VAAAAVARRARAVKSFMLVLISKRMILCCRGRGKSEKALYVIEVLMKKGPRRFAFRDKIILRYFHPTKGRASCFVTKKEQDELSTMIIPVVVTGIQQKR
jgi:hypothetical protein